MKKRHTAKTMNKLLYKTAIALLIAFNACTNRPPLEIDGEYKVYDIPFHVGLSAFLQNTQILFLAEVHNNPNSIALCFGEKSAAMYENSYAQKPKILLENVTLPPKVGPC